MRRSRSDLVLGLALALGACAWEDGDPWGIAELGLEAAFAPAPERLTAEGRLLTASGHALALDELVLGFDALSLRQSGGAPLAFDPADPPPGYSSCDNGHCHSDDGRLVSYEELAAELGAPVSGNTVTLAIEQDLPLGTPPATVPLGDCGEECWLERGGLGTLELLLHELVVSGRAYDPAGTSPPVEFAAELPLELAVGVPLAGEVGEEGLVARIDASFLLADTLFDDVDWAALDSSQGPVELEGPAVAARIEADSRLEVRVRWRE